MNSYCIEGGKSTQEGEGREPWRDQLEALKELGLVDVEANLDVRVASVSGLVVAATIVVMPQVRSSASRSSAGVCPEPACSSR